MYYLNNQTVFIIIMFVGVLVLLFFFKKEINASYSKSSFFLRRHCIVIAGY